MQDIKQRREGFDQLGKLYPKVTSVEITFEQISGLDCYWFVPQNPKSERLIIYVHGGAFAVGSIRSHGNMVSHIAEVVKTKIIFVEYALAPEHPYPAGINDVLKVYAALLKTYPGYRFDFVGESAGAGIIISSVSTIIKQHILLPQSVVLISPWSNLDCNYPSHLQNAGKDIISTAYLLASAQDYIGDSNAYDASPDHASLAEFPPVLILAGTAEILLDDSKHIYAKIKLIQKDTTLTLYDNQKHNWPLADINSEASGKVLNEIAEFLGRV